MDVRENHVNCLRGANEALLTNKKATTRKAVRQVLAVALADRETARDFETNVETPDTVIRDGISILQAKRLEERAFTTGNVLASLVVLLPPTREQTFEVPSEAAASTSKDGTTAGIVIL